MDIAFQMDHPSRLKAASDSTFMLIEEARSRGFNCFYYSPEHLSLNGREVVAQLQPLTIDHQNAPHYTLGEPLHRSLHEIDMVWMRQDPPFDMRYITATHFLEFLRGDTPVYNDPGAVRNAPEKISPLLFSEFMPPTIISGDAQIVAEFAAKHGQVVAKPLYGFGGRSVYKLAAHDSNIETLIEQNAERNDPPLMWQQFRPEVAKEDKRVILVDGKVECVFARLPAEHSIRANMRVGGTPAKAELNTHQAKICEAVGKMLKKEGLLLVGLDLIGDYLTEINVTCPTGLRAGQKLYGINLAATVWDAALATSK